MRGLVFASRKNMEGRNDAGGAFVPKSKDFAAFHGLGGVIFFDHDGTGKNKPKTVIYEALEAATGLDVVAYFGHGTKHGLPSAHMRWKDHVEFAEKIRKASNGPCKVVLYACSAGLPGYFASTLQKKLTAAYTVFGHDRTGHTCSNPYVTRFPSAEDEAYIIKPKSRLWTAWWCSLKCGQMRGNTQSTLWMRFPFLSQQDIEFELERYRWESLPFHHEDCPSLRQPKPARTPSGVLLPPPGTAAHPPRPVGSLGLTLA